MQMIELMMSSPDNFPYISYIISKTFFLWLKHVKACPHIKIYLSKHYSAFIQIEWVQGKFYFFLS